MHKLFAKQLARVRRQTGEVDIDRLAELVSAAYEEADNDRRRTDRSISLMIEELDRVNRRLLDAFDVVPEGLVLFDAEDRYVLWNKRYAELYPQTAEHLSVGAYFEDVLRAGLAHGQYPDARGHEEAWLAERMERHRRRNNSQEQHLPGDRWVRIEERRTADGGSIGVRIDITDLKRREASFRMLFESNPVPMWVYERGTLQFLAVNEAALLHLGYTKEQFLGMTLLDVKPPADREETKVRAASTEDFYSIDGARYLKADGTGIEVELYCRALTYEGRVARMVSLIDITERKRATAERTAALAEAARLRVQEKAAEEASRAKSSFLAVMSHEIRTPMNAVLGLASTMLESELPEEHRKTIMAIHEAGDSLLEILNDILDYSKLEAGQLSFEHIAFSPHSIVENALSIIGPRAKAKGLSLRTVIDPAVPRALIGDPGRIRQVLLNLIANAVKFTEEGGVSVSLRCREAAAGHATVEWVVADTGIGIAPDRIQSLFEDFVQADCSINRRFGGSGLGLAISKRILEQMGGEISVTSALGQGTTVRFHVALPVASSPASVERDDGSASAELHARIAALGRHLRLLIADDNATNRIVAAKMLREFNVQASMACDGAEAVAAASRLAYDVILMDMRMPEMDGLQAARAIRARGGPSAAVPIIAFTANAFNDDVNACMEAGMTDFVAKPVRKKVLVEALMRAWQPNDADAGGADDPAARPWEPADTAAAVAVPILDHAVVALLSDDIGADAMAETMSAFVTETVHRIESLRHLSCSDTDRRTISREAHSLRGTAGTFGLCRLAAIASELEREADTICEADYLVTIARIDTAFAEARSLLPVKTPLAA
jgi:PAS domain S-box-containing protein